MRATAHNCLARCVLILLAATASGTAVAQEAPVETELTHELAGDPLAKGSDFLLKVRAPWTAGACRLMPGSLLHATVASVSHAPSGHTAAITFTIAAPCEAHDAVPLMLISLLAAPKIETSQERFPSFGAPGHGGGFTATSLASSTIVNITKLPSTIKWGEVWHLPHITLVPPSPTGTTSTIATTRDKLELPKGSVFILLTTQKSAHPLALAISTAQHPVAAPSHSVEPFIRPCRPQDCSIDSAKLPLKAFGAERTALETDLTAFGLKPEHDHEMSELGTDTTLHFLDADELLLTFPTRDLVRRSDNERPTDERRSIRAVLFNTTTQSATRILDLAVDDHNRYVWPCGHNLLVHDGRSLRLFGPALQELAVLPLDNPLATLRIAPDGEHILLGEVHELHSEEEHRLLLETDRSGPQEEVLWSLLDGHLRRLRTLGISSSSMLPPVLLNTGPMELRKGHEQIWVLVGKPWEGGSEKTLGSLRSSCQPVLTDLSPNLLTITTCDVLGFASHTYVLRDDGSTLLESITDTQELPMTFAGSSNSNRIAALRTHATNAYTRGTLFYQSSIQSQTIEVFGTDRGTVLARLAVPQSAIFQDAFALSPDGSSLALLSGNTLRFYALRP